MSFSGEHCPDPDLEAHVAAALAKRAGECVVQVLEILGFAEIDGEMDKCLYREVEPRLREALGLASQIGSDLGRVARMEREVEAAKASILGGDE